MADHATRRHVRHRRVGDASVPCPSLPGPNMTDVGRQALSHPKTVYMKNISVIFFKPDMCSPSVVVAEWLRRWTRNPLGSSRAGSNPADNEAFAVLSHLPTCVAELLLLLFDNLKSQCTPNILCSSCVQQYKVLLIKRAYHYSTKKKVIARRMCYYFKVLVIISLSLFLFPEGGSVV